MGIARSTYYDTPKRGADDTALVEAMHLIKDEFEAYGWRRMQAALGQQGWVVNHKKLKRLMCEHELKARRRRRALSPCSRISRFSFLWFTTHPRWPSAACIRRQP